MKKKTRNYLIIASLVLIGIILGIIYAKTTVDVFGTPKKTEGLSVVATMQDDLTDNSVWVGTFQLIWNDLVNEVVKQDIIFTPQIPMVTNLNKQEFTTSMLSDSYYYKKYGFKTLELKSEIEKAIKEKFNQSSDILDLFDWSEDALNDPNDSRVDRYFFYVMLYRKFEFLKEFENLEKGNFGNYKDVKYFGTKDDSVGDMRGQIEVLFHNSTDDFAILINTKTDDEVIFYKSPKGNNFKEIYDYMNSETEKYEESRIFSGVDLFKAPNLKFNELREYDELTNKIFLTADGSVGEIMKAVQTIQFSLDAKGGEIKSEAGMDVKLTNAAPSDPRPRKFYVDNTFTIFLREKGKELPYFASKISDITKFQ